MALLPLAAGLEAFPPSAYVCGPGGRVEEHAHHAMHVVVAREGAVTVRIDGAEHAAPGVWVAADAAHAIDARGREVVLLFLDPESREGRALRARHGGAYATIDEGARAALLPRWPALPAGRDEALTTAALEALGVERDAPPAVLHPGVRRALRLMREAERPPSLEELAAAAGLSPGRLIHVFSEQVGIPPRRYLLWAKVQRAAGALARGASLTEAAHEAGFADGAHLSRTFRRTFGTTPSELVRNSRFVQAP